MTIHPRLKLGDRRRHFARRVLAVVMITATITLAALAVGARNWLMPRAPVAALIPPPTTAPVRPQQGTRQGSQMEAEIITITPRGFEPTEITRPKGPFILVVDDRSELDGVTFRLDREAGDRVREVRSVRERPDWDEVIDLTPGSYVLTEADHPDWLCRITITAQ